MPKGKSYEPKRTPEAHRLEREIERTENRSGMDRRDVNQRPVNVDQKGKNPYGK